VHELFGKSSYSDGLKFTQAQFPKVAFDWITGLTGFQKSSRSCYPVKNQGCLILNQLFGITPSSTARFPNDHRRATHDDYAAMRGLIT
jgi:hypothetical protein